MNEMTRTALQWYDWGGYLAIPFAYPPERRALVRWAKYQDNKTPRPSREMVASWFSRGWRSSPEGINLALICSINGLICLDFDDQESYQTWRNLLPGTPKTRIERSKRGLHVFYQVAETTNVQITPGIALDVLTRGTVHSYPSVHRGDGQTQYTVIEDQRPAQVRRIETVIPVEWRCYASQEPERKVRKEGEPAQTCTTGTPSLTQASRRVASPPSKVAVIKSTLKISDLVSRYVHLERTGQHHLSGRCPFHDDHDPSFWVDTRSGLCSCRKPECKRYQPRGRPMDAISFYARVEHISNGQAIARLYGGL